MRTCIRGVVGEIDNLPGCDQVGVIHNVFTPPNNRKKGNGKEAHQLRLRMMDDLLYDYALCTVVSTNETEKSILRKSGWQFLSQFKSRKTQNVVELWGRSVRLDAFRDFPTLPEMKTYDEWERSLESCRS